MLSDDGRQMTLCGILKKIAESTEDEKIKAMITEATSIAKKMDAKLKEYSLQARRTAQSLVMDNWQ